jgi:hypothetical protein
MTAIFQHAEVIRFAAMATFLALALLLGRLGIRLAPARRTRLSAPAPQLRANPTVLSWGGVLGRALIQAMMMGQPRWKRICITPFVRPTSRRFRNAGRSARLSSWPPDWCASGIQA